MQGEIGAIGENKIVTGSLQPFIFPSLPEETVSNKEGKGGKLILS